MRGEGGDLTIDPKLVREQFDESGKAAIQFDFAGRNFQVTIANLSGRDFGQYRVEKAYLTTAEQPEISLPIVDGTVVLEREKLLGLPDSKCGHTCL